MPGRGVFRKGGFHMRIFKIGKRRNGTTNRFASSLFCVVLLGGIVSGTSAKAMSAPVQSSVPSTATSAGWNSANSPAGEIKVLGTIRQVVSNHDAGGPAGVHILIDGPLGSFDASLGSFLPNDVRQALSNGAPVQITGIVRSANGKDYLLVRQLNVGGHQVTIRNANGFLVHNSSSTGAASGKVRSEGNGGIR
jgi:hypothetical protein